MLQFINGFSCATDPENSQLIIQFLQQRPNFDEENNNVVLEEVSSIVMGKVTAQRLLEGLRELLDDEEA